MIVKNAEVGEKNDVIVAVFGKGTLAVVNSNDPQKSKSILIKKTEKHHIGEEFQTKGMPADKWLADIIIRFENKEGFDVFYEFVENVRKDFESELTITEK